MANPDRLPADCPTAFYTFDVRVLSRRVAYLRSRLPENCSLCYAVKANPFIAGEIADRVDAFEICSPGEAAVCRALGIKSEKTVISGVYKTPSFIEGLIADADFRGVLTVESTTQYRLFCDLAEKYGRQIRVLLRLTNDSQFGINEDEIDEIVSSSEKTPPCSSAAGRRSSCAPRTIRWRMWRRRMRSKSPADTASRDSGIVPTS